MNEASTRKRMGLVVALIVLVALITVLVTALPTRQAGATDNTPNENCETFTDHSGHIPGSYDYAEFYEDGVLVVSVETNGEDIFVNPAGYDAGESWDVVEKCHRPEDTTTTTEGTTTTTAPETTTTVPETTTITEPEDQVAVWDGDSDCDRIVVSFDEGIAQVDVWFRDPQFGDFGPADGIVPFTESGSQITGIDGEFILIPVVEVGWVVVPDQIVVQTSVCEEPTTTTVTPTTTPTTAPPELPFTGIDEMTMKTLIFVGAVALIFGFMFVMGARCNREVKGA